MQRHIVLKPLSATYGVTVGVTVTSLPSIPANALQATIQVETTPVRARFDATISVTSGVGGGLYLSTVGAGKEYIIEGWDNLDRMRMVSDQGSTISKINVVYEGEGQP